MNILGEHLLKMSEYYNENKIKDEDELDFFIKYCDKRIDLRKIDIEKLKLKIFDIFKKNDFSIGEVLDNISYANNISKEDILNTSYFELKNKLENEFIKLQNEVISKELEKINILLKDAIISEYLFSLEDFIGLIILFNIK